MHNTTTKSLKETLRTRDFNFRGTLVAAPDNEVDAREEMIFERGILVGSLSTILGGSFIYCFIVTLCGG